ncbi:TPA: hypothetical protein N0H21_001279 [Pseudomonas aeruginosa]|nr:hypothetical protein [Pseudomonas aeruginosa]
MKEALDTVIKIQRSYRWIEDKSRIDELLKEVDFWNKYEKSLSQFLKTGNKDFYEEFLHYHLAITDEENKRKVNVYKDKIQEKLNSIILENNLNEFEAKYSKALGIENFKINKENIDEFSQCFIRYDIDIILDRNIEHGITEIRKIFGIEK